MINRKVYIFFTIMVSLFVNACNTSDDDDRTSTSLDFDYKQYGESFQQMPAPEDAVIYQVNLRAFSEAGTINAVTERLDHIQSLGINVLYLMPIYPNGIENSAGGLGSPYAVRDYKAVSEEYGSLADLRNLVEEAHDRGMAVVLDWVANHTAWDNNWVEEHPEYYVTNENGEMIPPAGTNWNDVVQLDFENENLQHAMIDAMAYWVYQANIDGFRCDAADYVPEGFWTAAVSSLRGIKDQELLMLAEGGEQRHLRSGFDYIFGFHYFETLKEIHNGEPATSIQLTHGDEYSTVYDDDKRVVRYTTNHDVNLSDGTPQELFGGLEGSTATFVVAAYMKSALFIYNGQEIGYDQRLAFFNKTPINWSQANEEVYAEYQQILQIRANSPAVTHGDYTGYSSANIVSFTMSNDEESVWVLANMRNQESSYIVPPALSGEWQNTMTNTSQNLVNEITLAPYEYYILKNNQNFKNNALTYTST